VESLAQFRDSRGSSGSGTGVALEIPIQSFFKLPAIEGAWAFGKLVAL
jgi:hypothetical protein